MILRASELYEKEVICIQDGSRLGFLGDFEFNTSSGHIETIIIYGRSRFFGLFGKDEDKIIPISCVEIFGEEVILVDYEPPRPRHKNSKGLLKTFFE